MREERAYTWVGSGSEFYKHRQTLDEWLTAGWLVDGTSVQLVYRRGHTNDICFFCTLYRLKAGK